MPSHTKQPSLNAYYIHETVTDSPIVRELMSNSRRGKAAMRMHDEARELCAKRNDDESQRMLIMAECERLCVAFYEFVDLVLDCEMIAAGFHYHRGEWRKRRVPKQQRQQQTAQLADVNETPPVARRSRGNQCPARRPMPVCKPLNCRCPLVRGDFGRWRMIRRSRTRQQQARRWAVRKLPNRKINSGVRRPIRRWRCRRKRTIPVGLGNDPRPPPM